MEIQQDPVVQKKKKQQLFELDTTFGNNFAKFAGRNFDFKNVVDRWPEILVRKANCRVVTDRVMLQKMITEFLTSTFFLLKRLAPIYILSKIYISNVSVSKKMLTTEILDMCVTYKRNATFNEKLNELRS